MGSGAQVDETGFGQQGQNNSETAGKRNVDLSKPLR